MNPLANRQEIVHATEAEVIYQGRMRLLKHAAEIGNFSQACRVLGVSRTRYYQWKDLADHYG